MKFKITFATKGLLAAAMLASTMANAQDVHFTQFNAASMTINPAFTGAFQGDWRASAIYRDQWRSVTGAAAFKTIAASFDMPIVRDIAIDDYLAAGLQLYNDVAGDGNLANFTVMGSVAYHKFLGTDAKKALSVGIQGGYTQKSVDLSKLYFGDEFNEGYWQQGTSNEYPWLNNRVSGFVINAGLAWSHSITNRISYTIGGGVNNINQPLESMSKRQASKEVGLAMRYTGQLGAIIGINDRFSLRPAVLFQSQASAMEIVGGNEFHYKLGEEYDLPSAFGVFLGGWYRHQDAIMANVGVEWKGFRVGVAYDYNISDLKHASNGNGGFELMLRYIQPSAIDFARKLLYPCGRF